MKNHRLLSSSLKMRRSMEGTRVPAVTVAMTSWPCQGEIEMILVGVVLDRGADKVTLTAG